ncbi:uncharacterized protein LOC119387656 [Rhipicephalus sanguineus]|uniref:uncharacterized protein LOC119387656 n=1 Tax=Rhipicephalus sanguineus TaxID=34632 RepID=UPI0018930E1A|nr:uncharacterized protein LOC119387656 [Rhipicephalus sanguineus]
MADSVDVVDAESIRNMKVADLKKELKARGLSTAGNKSELTERLEAALGLPKADMSDVQLDESLDQGVDVNDDEALLEESLLLPTEGKANNGDVLASEEELLATPVTKEPPAAAKISLEAGSLGAQSTGVAAPAATPQKTVVTPTAKEPASTESEAKKVRLKVTCPTRRRGRVVRLRRLVLPRCPPRDFLWKRGYPFAPRSSTCHFRTLHDSKYGWKGLVLLPRTAQLHRRRPQRPPQAR